MQFSDLSTDLQNWLRQSIAAGCSHASLVQAMRVAGYEAEFSRRAADAAVGALGPATGHSAVAPAMGADTSSPAGAGGSVAAGNSSEILAAGANVIDAGDRDVHILLVLNSPRIILFGDLLAAQECEQLIEMSRGKLERSNVVNRQTGKHDVHPDRTSAGTYFQRDENELIGRIERRLAELTSCPLENGEPIQVLHYTPGAQYKPHYDYFEPSHEGNAQILSRGGQRIATLVMYLNDVEAGGSTVFPEIGLDVLPRRGNAVFFAYADPEGRLDPRSLHGGNPVTAGEKWIATKWFRQRAYSAA